MAGSARSLRQTYGATGSIESGEDAVSGVLDQVAAVSLNRLARQLVVTVQQPSPVLIAHFGGATRRVDDVGEQYGGQDALQIGRFSLAMPGDELFDVAEQRLYVA